MWNRNTDDRKSHRAQIARAAGIRACDDSQRECQQNSDEHSCRGEFDRCGETFSDEARDGLAIRNRFAQITDGESAQIRRVLRKERAVEAELTAHSDDVGGRGSLAEHRDHWIAGYQVNDRECQRRDTNRDRYQREQPPHEMFDHFTIATGCPPPPGTASFNVASERRLPFGYASKPTSRRFITATLSTHHSDTYGTSSAASCCTCA